ncbi:hypothetical protein [Blastococcus sp. CT_GayMR16]|uniref:hypothetical protein n=1 Tax=Blastococcus sp. CT_GayMR16 TaxID=2559607 RepID=UPI001ADD6D9F|nr:hypothetical protein [Blastococcus sp. CT_GayMR16]
MTTALDRVGQRAAAVPSPGRVGQATAVEQARAVAEVQAAVMVAQQVPRNMELATSQMQESCEQKALADRAFFAYPRAGEQITGPSIHLARELARCFGNVQYGINELRRDDEHHQSEMLAWAWDVQNNTRSTATFIVPHATDTRNGRKDLTDLRDVYENNANHGARRLREMIFAILPTWFTEEAKQICQATIEAGNGSPLADRVKEAIEAFANGPKVIEAQLVKRVGKPVDQWTAADISQLEVLYQSLRRRETTVHEAFGDPETSVKKDEITGGEATKGPKATQGQMGRIHALLKDRNVESDDGVRQAISAIIGRALKSRRDLLRTEADTVIARLEETGPPPPDGDDPPPPDEDRDESAGEQS